MSLRFWLMGMMSGLLGVALGTVLLRSPQSTPGSLMGAGESSGGGQSALGGLAEMFSLDSGFETELEILGSRAVAGAVVDSLGLQARVLASSPVQGTVSAGTFGVVIDVPGIKGLSVTGDHWRTRLIAFSDDMDGLRKVPDNVPNQDMVRQHLGKPVTSVPDPFGTHDSFAIPSQSTCGPS